MIVIKTERELTYMRDAGRVVAEVFEEIKDAITPGITTKQLDIMAEDYVLKQGARPAFKGYGGFPATLCTSVNEEVVHGIPGLRKLENGDIISIDCGAVINGFVGDSALTFPVGTISKEAEELLRVTEESLYAGIAQARDGNRLSDISNAVQQHVEKQGMSVVRDYVGHGIGAKMHEEPQIANFGRPGRGPRLKQGMTLAIEPMVNLGTFEVRTLPDNWTVVTLDGRLSAHFEHTIAITDDTPEILTKI